MNPIEQFKQLQTRRQFFAKGKHLLGGAALASLIGNSMAGKAFASPTPDLPLPHFAAKAKRVIYLHMVGGPSQMDLFDYKPTCLLYTSPSPRDQRGSRMPSSA